MTSVTLVFPWNGFRHFLWNIRGKASGQELCLFIPAGKPVDKRIASSVLMAGIGSFTDIAMLNNPDLQGEPLAMLQAAMDPTDPIHYIGHAAPSAVFFQSGTNDTFFTRQKFLVFSQATRRSETHPLV